ncbi:MAG: pyrroline-5-carboxylate reductase [Fibrobacter sp.]|nr:pyrroline-5-carboxylate reductase [Fibrobacter sp.]
MRVAILGTGNMGKAIISGLLNSRGKTFTLIAYDIIKSAYTGLPANVQIASPSEWIEIGIPEVIIIAVKPDDVQKVIGSLEPLKKHFFESLWISIAAGISLSFLESCIGSKSRICRVMPNTPALVGDGISAYSLNKNCTEDDVVNVETVFNVCGKTVAVPEKMMNAVTGLSGSGPAYVFQFIEALIEGGVTAGLSYDIAKECAIQTVIGAANMIAKTRESPSVLKSKVMSPAGTTVKGLLALEKYGFKYSIIKAIKDASERAEELGM